MICAIDVGNTKAKVFLIDDDYDIIDQLTISTPVLFEPEEWKKLFEILNDTNPLFLIAELRISCVNWKAFLALRIYLKYDTIKNFDIHKDFDVELLNSLPEHSPVVLEKYIPLKRDNVQGLIGTDRMLSAYAVNRIFNKSVVIVSLGTATTIDLITKGGEFISGVIAPGVDVAYQGLIERATSLPSLSDLTLTENTISKNGLESLYTGAFTAQAVLIEQFASRLTKEASVSAEIILTGGRANSISRHLTKKHKVVENLVGYGLALLPKWNGQAKIHKKKFTSLASKITTK